MDGSSDVNLLIDICNRDIVGQRISIVEWLWFSDCPNFVFAPRVGRIGHLNPEFSDWNLLDIASGNEIANSRQPFEQFRIPMENLAGATITSFTVDEGRALAFTAEFDANLRFQIEPCECELDDMETACWAFDCSDDHVILVGVKDGVWRRIHRDDPYYGSKHRPFP